MIPRTCPTCCAYRGSAAPNARRRTTRQARPTRLRARLDRRGAHLTALGAANRALGTHAATNCSIDREKRGKSTIWPERPREGPHLPRLALPSAEHRLGRAHAAL